MSSPLGHGPSPLRFHHTASELTTPYTPDSAIDPNLERPASSVNGDNDDEDDGISPEDDLESAGDNTPRSTRSQRAKFIPGMYGYIQNVRDGPKLVGK